jgi:hypothetical protein
MESLPLHKFLFIMNLRRIWGVVAILTIAVVVYVILSSLRRTVPPDTVRKINNKAPMSGP